MRISLAFRSATLFFLMSFSPFAPAQAIHGHEDHPTETLHAKASPALPAYKPVANLSGEIRSVGADTMEDLMKLWIAGFQKIYPNVKIQMEAKASGTAAPALTNGTADIGPVAREVLPNEEEPFRAKFGYDLFPVRVAGGSYRTPGRTHAITFFVNSKNPIDKLNFQQLDAIYSTTRKAGAPKDITTWGQLGLTGDWADKPIHLWGLKRPNGIANFIQDRVLKGGEYKDGINEHTTVGNLPALDAIARGVADDPYAIGYTGFANLIDGTKTVALSAKPGGPYYKGTFDEVASYKFPLSRVIYIYLNRKPGAPLDPPVREFLRFVLSRDGQKLVEQEGIFLPLTPSIVKEELAKVQ